MGALNRTIQKVARLAAPKERRIADDKRALERQLRAGGLSINEAKKAVAAAFKGRGE